MTSFVMEYSSVPDASSKPILVIALLSDLMRMWNFGGSISEKASRIKPEAFVDVESSVQSNTATYCIACPRISPPKNSLVFTFTYMS